MCRAAIRNAPLKLDERRDDGGHGKERCLPMIRYKTMRFISAVFVLLTCSLLGMAQSTLQDSSDSATQQELIRIAQQLLDAVASGDKAVWEKYIADDIIYTDENWRILTKKQLLDSLAPLPKGYSGSIRIANAQSRINGDSAVLSYRALEEESIFGQKISPVYLVTETYFKRDGRWQMIASHVVVRPSERKPIAIKTRLYKSIVGEYELTPGVIYTVTLEGDKLMGQRTGRAKEELLPADESTFFPKGTIRGEKVFVRDATGRATEMLDRRENNDLVWKKVK
jgi:Domain of unknown function (DUF4440)